MVKIQVWTLDLRHRLPPLLDDMQLLICQGLQPHIDVPTQFIEQFNPSLTRHTIINRRRGR